MSEYRYYKAEPISGHNQIVTNLINQGRNGCFFTYEDNGKPRIAVGSDSTCQAAMRKASSDTGWRYSEVERQEIPNVVLIEVPAQPGVTPQANQNIIPVNQESNQPVTAEHGNNTWLWVGLAVVAFYVLK